MSGWTNAVEQDVLEYWFAGSAIPDTPTHIALYTVAPTETGGGTEVSTAGTSYARQAFAANGTNWGNSTAGAPSTISNLVAVTFPEATGGGFGTVVAWGYCSAGTAGVDNVLFWAPLDTNKAVDAGDTAQFGVGDLVAKLGDPGDTY